MTNRRRPARLLAALIEWPTLILIVLTYLAFGLVTLNFSVLPWWLVLPAGGFIVCLHGSLQHEAVHGHPTPWRRVNELLVFPSLWLWMPYGLYRATHLRHHRDRHLTDPLDDPESYYVTEDAWRRKGPVRQAVCKLCNTLAGRLLVHPLLCTAMLWWREGQRLLRGDLAHGRPWLAHLVSIGLVLAWVVGVCGMPLETYIAFFAYPGLSLTLLRSFLEHRAHPDPAKRTVVVEAGPLMSLLFLNNNLHALHHAEPGLPWYRLPGRYRERRDALLAANGDYRLTGYGEVAARYLFRAKEPVVHPFAGGSDRAPRLVEAAASA